MGLRKRVIYYCRQLQQYNLTMYNWLCSKDKVRCLVRNWGLGDWPADSVGICESVLDLGSMGQHLDVVFSAAVMGRAVVGPVGLTYPEIYG